jgi:hypothetical protein
MPHLVHAIACCAVLRDSQMQGNWTDDRPPKTPNGWVRELNQKAAALLERYPDAKPAYTELGQKLHVGSETAGRVIETT